MPTNILIILADDIGPADVRAYRGEFPTPRLGELAQRGARFWNAWTTPVCLATRAGLMTGWYGPRTGHVGHTGDFAVALERDAQFIARGTIAHALRAPGYTTAVSGKWQHAVSPGECGFDRHFIWARWNADGVIYPRYWRPVLWEDGLKRRFDQYGPDLIAEWTIDFLRNNSPAFVLHNELLAHKEGGTFQPTPGQRRGTRRSNIVYWTRIVDRIVKALPDTLVLITSDNGSEATTKNQISGDGPRTILIGVGPGVVPGERHQLVDVSDFYPTILELAGGDGRGRDGVSFAEALRSPSAPGGVDLFMARRQRHGQDAYAPEGGGWLDSRS